MQDAVKNRRLQNHADVSTFVCAICFGFLVYVLENQPSGAAALGIIVPLIIVVPLHLTLGLYALISAISTGRAIRNLWIYFYFAGVFLYTLGNLGIYHGIYQSMQATLEKRSHPDETRLYEAIASGDSDGVKAAIQAGANLSFCFSRVAAYQNYSPVQYAVKNSGRSVVALLLTQGADPDLQCANDVAARSSALTTAVRKKELGLIKALLHAGADPNAKTQDTPLGAALAINSSLPNEDNILGVRRSLNMQALRVTARLLLEAGADPNVVHYGIAPIHWAAVLGDEQLFRALVAKGADIGTNDKRGRNALVLALVYRSKKLIEMMFDELMLDLAGRPGFLALQVVGRRKNRDLITRLLASGLDLSLLYDERYRQSVRDPYARSIDLAEELFQALQSGNEVYLDGLINAGADVNQPDRQGMLLVARVGDNVAKLQLIVLKGADINRAGAGQNSALHYFASCKRCINSLVAIQNLLDLGADINAVNASGHTPLGMAKWINLPDVVAFLQEKGAVRKQASDI